MKTSGFVSSLILLIIFGIVVLGGLGAFLFKDNFISPSQNTKIESNPSPSPTLTTKATQKPTPSPTPTPKPTLKPTPKPTSTQTSTDSGSYTCTLFIGYSQTNNWFPAF